MGIKIFPCFEQAPNIYIYIYIYIYTYSSSELQLSGEWEKNYLFGFKEYPSQTAPASSPKKGEGWIY